MVLQSDAVDVSRLEGLAMSEHYNYLNRSEHDPYLADPSDVASYAEQLARRYCDRSQVGRVSLPMVTNATCAAYLVYAVDRYGYDFVGIARQVNQTVAEIVGEVSADMRLNTGPRRTDQIQRLYHASDTSQIVRFAELYASAEAVITRINYDPEQARREHDPILTWIQNQSAQRDVLGNRLFADPKFRPVVVKLEGYFQEIHNRIRRQRHRALAVDVMVSGTTTPAGLESYRGGEIAPRSSCNALAASA